MANFRRGDKVEHPSMGVGIVDGRMDRKGYQPVLFGGSCVPYKADAALLKAWAAPRDDA